MYLVLLLVSFGHVSANAIDLLDVSSLEPVSPNYCNDSSVMDEGGLYKATMGQFLGYECSAEFYHCRWQSDGFRTYRKHCKTGLVYDVFGTQNCNYDYNVKSCGIRSGAPSACNSTSFRCVMSDECVVLSKRCDSHYDCASEEDEQNCPLCMANEFACIVSEECIELDRRCNGITECSDGTDELDCDVCGNGLFHCAKSGECIPNEHRCDGKRQCPNGEDEMLCKKRPEERKFTCQSGMQHIPMAQLCDGRPQCSDGSDEAYCEMGVGAGSAAGSSIVFSSNPNVAEPVASSDYDTEYEQVATETPFFPMLSMTLAPAAAPIFTAPPATRAPHRIAPLAKSTPWASSGSFRKQPTEATATPSVRHTIPIRTTPLSTTHRLPPRTTTPSPPALPVFVPRKSTGVSEKNASRYQTRPASEDNNRVLPVVQNEVRPRNEEPKLLYAQLSSSREIQQQQQRRKGEATEVIHEVRVSPLETTTPTDDAKPRNKILQHLGGLNDRISPDLLSKIEKLLVDEMQSKLAHENTSGFISESSVLLSHSAPVPSTPLVRSFSSKVQKMDEKM